MPVGDLGIRRGVQLIYGLEDVATPRQVREKAPLAALSQYRVDLPMERREAENRSK
jgi:hypothetical protein